MFGESRRREEKEDRNEDPYINIIPTGENPEWEIKKKVEVDNRRLLRWL